MFKLKFLKSKSEKFSNDERINIILKYMEYNAKLAILKSFREPDKAEYHRCIAAALTSMYYLCQSDKKIMEIERELQQVKDSPIWAIELL